MANGTNNPRRRDLTDEPAGSPDSDSASSESTAPDESETTDSESTSATPPSDIQDRGDETGSPSSGSDTGSETPDSSGSTNGSESNQPSEPPEDVQDSGPGAGDSETSSESPEPVDEPSNEVESPSETTSAPRDVQEAAPGDGASDEPVSTEQVQNDQWIEDNYERGPRGASERISGEDGISDSGSPRDPLEGTGREAGLGRTADLARDVEEQIVSEPDSADGRQQADGVGGRDVTSDISRDDIEVRAGDGTLRVEVARDQLSQEGVDNIDDGPTQDPTELERQTTSGVTPDYTTAVTNQVEQALEERGVDTDKVDIQTGVEDGRIRADVEPAETTDRGDFEVRVPSALDDDTFVEQAAENTLGTLSGVAGPATGTVVGAGADALGIGGARSEDLLGEASGEIQSTIDETAPTGGDIVEDAMASGALGPAVGTQMASDLADLGIALADEQTGGLAGEAVDSYTEGAYKGGAALADAPGTLVSVKEGGEYVAYGASETAAGRGDEFADETGAMAGEAIASATAAAEEDPVGTAGMVGGSLVASTVGMGGASAVSSRAGAVTRYAIQPGEEVLTDSANVLASRSSTIARGVDELPGGRLDNEELAIEAGRRVRDRVEPAVRRAGYDLQQRVASNSDSSMRSVLDDESSPTATDGGSSLSLSQDVRQQIRQFIDDDRGQMQMAPPESSEVDVEQSGVDQPDTEFEPDRGTILEGSPRDQMSNDVSSRALEETRSAAGDYEGVNSQFEGASRQDRATFDPDEIRQPRDFDPRSEQGRGDAGQDFSGYLERRRKAEQSTVPRQTELEQELQRPRAAEATLAEELQGTGIGIQESVDVAETPGLESRPFQAESEAAGELGLEAESELAQEMEAEAMAESQFDSVFEFGIEAESETESELETEFEAENRERVSLGEQLGAETSDGETLSQELDATDFENPWASPGEALFGGDLFNGGGDA